MQSEIHSIIEKYGYENVQQACNEYLYNKNKNEPILNKNNHRFTIFPIKYSTLWQQYKDQLASFWKPEQINFAGDYEDFMTLNPNEQHFIKMILAFFAQSDGIVNFNLSERFIREIQITEAVVCYQYQEMMENIHSEVYSLMLDNIIKDPIEKNKLFNAITEVSSVGKMAEWAFKWIDSPKLFSYRVIAFAVVEAVFFSGAFAAIFWLKKTKNIGNNSNSQFMNGLITSNKFISRDESMHYMFACEIYKLLADKLPRTEVIEIIDEGVKISQEFMTDALPVSLIGMNNKSMAEYIEYIADRLLIMLGYNKHYNKQNPFPFMDSIGMKDKSNFFEVTVHEYQSSSNEGALPNVSNEF